MKDAKRFIKNNMGYAKSSVMTDPIPYTEMEDTCPLCGHFMRLDERGYCNTRECNENARNRIREIVRENGGENIPGVYYKFGTQEIFFFNSVECWKEPAQIKHPDMCQFGECTRWALPADYLCRTHRLEENQIEYRARKQKRTKKTQRVKKPRMVGNRIKGLDKVKI